MGTDALDGRDAADDLGDGGVAVGRQERTGVADLAARVGVEAGVVEHDFDFIAGFGCGNTLPSLTIAKTSQSVRPAAL